VPSVGSPSKGPGPSACPSVIPSFGSTGPYCLSNTARRALTPTCPRTSVVFFVRSRGTPLCATSGPSPSPPFSLILFSPPAALAFFFLLGLPELTLFLSPKAPFPRSCGVGNVPTLFFLTSHTRFFLRLKFNFFFLFLVFIREIELFMTNDLVFVRTINFSFFSRGDY